MKKVSELVSDIGFFYLANFTNDPTVTHLTHNSTEAICGSLFFALPGTNTNGKMYALNAIAKGAVAVVVEEELDDAIPQIVVKDVRTTMSLIAKAFYNNACDDMKIIGITGTNGKTTTSHIIFHILSANKIPCAVIGTLGVKTFPAMDITSSLTTPDPIELHGIFAELQSNGIKKVIMECSAHAIALKKLEGIQFAQGLFTNLSLDHLDFFGDYRTYADTKINWFNDKMDLAIVNADDVEYDAVLNSWTKSNSLKNIYHPHARPLKGSSLKGVRGEAPPPFLGPHERVGGVKLNPNKKLLSYGIDKEDANLVAFDIAFNDAGTSFSAIAKKRSFKVATTFKGRFNVYNTLAAILSCQNLGLKNAQIVKVLRSLPPVPGRFNTLQVNDFTVIIDYAHTPDSLEKIINSSRELVQEGGRLITLFGCGGNRDIEKRPIMGEFSTRLSDFTIITSDNPRDESPLSIMLQIEAGAKLNDNQTTNHMGLGKHHSLADLVLGDITMSYHSSILHKTEDDTTPLYFMIEDRKDAIIHALNMGNKGDVIIIAGKGAEDYQEIKGKKFPFSDTEVVKSHNNQSFGNEDQREHAEDKTTE